MTSPSETATDHQMAAEDDEGMLGRIPDPAGPLPTENPWPADYARVWQPGPTAVAARRRNRRSSAGVTLRDPRRSDSARRGARASS